MQSLSAIVGQSVTFTATVGGGVSPTGTVSFYDGSTLLGTVSLTSGKASVIVTLQTPGAHTLTASYNADAANFGSSTSATVNVLSSTTITWPTQSLAAVVGQSTTLSVTIKGSSPTGNVSFYDGSSLLGTAPLVSGTASIATTPTALGARTITIVYGGDANNAPSSSPLTLTVLSSTTIDLPAQSLTAIAGQAVTFTATVGGGVSPSGMVSFFDGSTLLSTVDLASSKATLSTTFQTRGARTLSALYKGDAVNASSTTSAALNVLSPTTIGWPAGSTLTAVANRPITLAVTVSGYSPTGTVSLYDGSTLLGTTSLVSGAAAITTTVPAPGTHAVSVAYGGDGNNAPSSSPATLTVLNPTAISLPAQNLTAVAGQAASFTATLSGGISPSGTVSFYDGSTLLGTASLASGTATLSTAFQTRGSRSLTATYQGDAVNASSTTSAALNVLSPTTIAAPSGSNLITVAGRSTTLSVTISGYSPTGTVSFYDGTTLLGTATLVSGTGSITATLPAPGIHAISISYSGDTNNAASTTNVKLNVNLRPEQLIPILELLLLDD